MTVATCQHLLPSFAAAPQLFQPCCWCCCYCYTLLPLAPAGPLLLQPVFIAVHCATSVTLSALHAPVRSPRLHCFHWSIEGCQSWQDGWCLGPLAATALG